MQTETKTLQVTECLWIQELPSPAQRPTWPRRWREGIDSVPRRMCGAAAVCCCTCSTDATHGYVTTPIRCVSRWGRLLCCCRKVRWQMIDSVCRVLVRLSTSLLLCGRCRPTATTSQPKCSGPDSGRIPTDEHLQGSSGGKPQKPSEQVDVVYFKIILRCKNILKLRQS